MLKLYELAQEYVTALEWVEEHEDEIKAAGGVIPPALAAILDGIEADFDTKVERTGLVIRTLEANAKAAGEEADRLAALAKSYQRASDTLGAYCLQQMRKVDRDSVDGALCKVWVQKNGRPSVRPLDPANPPEAFVREVPAAREFDAGHAYESLRIAGAIPPGVGRYELPELGVVVERGCHLRVK